MKALTIIIIATWPSKRKTYALEYYSKIWSTIQYSLVKILNNGYSNAWSSVVRCLLW